MKALAWLKGLISAAAVTLSTTAQAAYEQPSMRMLEQGIELSQRSCEYGRGTRVVNDLKKSLSESFIHYLTNQAKSDLATLLAEKNTEQTSVDAVAAINFPQAAAGLKNHQQQLQFAEPSWQGNETCLQASLKLTPDSKTSQTALNIDWQTTPTTVWQFSQATVDMSVKPLSNSKKSLEDIAMQQALQNAIANNIQLLAEQGASKFAILKKHANKIQLADIQNLYNGWQVLNKQASDITYTTQLLVSLNSPKLEQELSHLVKKVTDSSIYLSAEPFTLKRQLLSILTANNIRIANSANAADIHISAKASMLEQNNGYQNLIELEVTNLNKQVIWQWQNDPGLITVSNNQAQQMNQLIQAHMSLPQHQTLIIQQLEFLLLEQALATN